MAGHGAENFFTLAHAWPNAIPDIDARRASFVFYACMTARLGHTCLSIEAD